LPQLYHDESDQLAIFLTTALDDRAAFCVPKVRQAGSVR
jgi:hypothetical protein